METHLLADGGRDLRAHHELLTTIGDAIERFENAGQSVIDAGMHLR
jgi:hypothetical protein